MHVSLGNLPDPTHIYVSVSRRYLWPSETATSAELNSRKERKKDKLNWR